MVLLWHCPPFLLDTHCPAAPSSLQDAYMLTHSVLLWYFLLASGHPNRAFQVAANTEVMAFFVMWSRAAAGILSLSMAAFKPAMSAIMCSYFTMFRCVSLRNPRPRRAWQALRGVLDRGLAHPYTTRFVPSSITQTLARGLQELDTAVATLQQQAQLLAQHRAQ